MIHCALLLFRLSGSLTLQREITSPIASIGETIEVGAFSNVPFEYVAEASSEGRIREVNLLNNESSLLATEYEHLHRFED